MNMFVLWFICYMFICYMFCTAVNVFCVNDHHSYVHNLLAVVKIKPEKKKFGLERESNPDLAITGAVLSPVSYPSQLADGHS